MRILSWSPNFDARMRDRVVTLQKITDSMILQYATPFTPMQSGALIQSALRGTVIGSGWLVWDSPYAHYLYEGRVMGPNIPLADDGGFFSRGPKYYTGQMLTFHGSPMRGAKWVQRMDEKRHTQLVRGIQNAYERRMR